MDGNPLLAMGGLPQFDRVDASHVVPGVREVLQRAVELLEKIESTAESSWAGLIEPLEEIDHLFEYGWSPVTHLFGVKNSPELREAYETVQGEVVDFSLRAGQSRPIYERLCQIRDGDEWSSLDAAQQRIIEKKILAAKLAGIGLDGDQRDRFNDIARELSELGTRFSNNVLDATKAYSLTLIDSNDAAGLPENLRQLMAQSFNEHRDDGSPEATAEAGPWRVTLDAPVFGPFMEHCRNRDLREQVYRAYITRASTGDVDNADIITKILQLRREKAALLGYATFAELSLARKMAPNVAAVEQMFETLRASSTGPAEAEMKDVESIAAESGQAEPVRHWDVAFWAERLREQRFNFTDEQLRPYFPLERVLDGMFGLATRLFGITVEAADGSAPVWHDDVRFFHINNESGDRIASFYLDPYSRPENKRGGAWMDDCLGRCRIDDAVRQPVAHLVCNGTPPVGDKPSLMTFREVETLFHEFGHGLQHMLTTVNFADAAGINGVEWDAVELPSQFMENWCYHRPTLIGMTSHFETGEPLPDDLFQKICSARTFRAGSMMLRQLQFGMTDIELHSRLDPDGDETAFDVHRRISELTSTLPPLPENRFLCSFQHIFAGGYAAGYYSYKWAEVLSADAFGAFEDAGLDDAKAVEDAGRRFRDTVLAQGGSRHPMDIFRDFRGREPTVDALLRHSGLT